MSDLSDKINDKLQKPITNTEKLNNALKAIIRRIPVKWENANEVRRIDKIIKGKNNYLKRAVIAEYKNYEKK